MWYTPPWRRSQNVHWGYRPGCSSLSYTLLRPFGFCLLMISCVSICGQHLCTYYLFTAPQYLTGCGVYLSISTFYNMVTICWFPTYSPCLISFGYTPSDKLPMFSSPFYGCWTLLIDCGVLLQFPLLPVLFVILLSYNIFLFIHICKRTALSVWNIWH